MVPTSQSSRILHCKWQDGLHNPKKRRQFLSEAPAGTEGSDRRHLLCGKTNCQPGGGAACRHCFFPPPPRRAHAQAESLSSRFSLLRLPLLHPTARPSAPPPTPPHHPP